MHNQEPVSVASVLPCYDTRFSSSCQFSTISFHQPIRRKTRQNLHEIDKIRPFWRFRVDFFPFYQKSFPDDFYGRLILKVEKRKLESSICTQYKYILYSYKRIIQVYTVPTCKYTNCQLSCPSRGRHFTFFTITFFVHKYHFMQS